MAKKVQNNNNIGNPWHDDQGQFTTPGGGGSGNTDNQNNNSNVNNIPSFLRAKGGNISDNGVPSFLKKKNNQNASNNSTSEQIKKIRQNLWWKNRDVYTPQDVIDNIDKFFDDDVIEFLKKYNFDSTNTMGAPKTSHSHINSTLFNAMAHKAFHPLKIMEDKEFDTITRRLYMQGNHYGSGVPYAEYGFIQRGFSNKEIIKSYLGETNPDCILTAGAYGSCIYTAYDGYTAQGYARRKGPNGYVMNFVVDNQKAKTIKKSDYIAKRRELIKKLPETETKIIQSLKQQGKDDMTANRIAKIYRNTLTKDDTFGAFLMGYEMLYEDGVQYGLLLNFKNAYTKKDW